jgi:hypothetical protein
MIVCLFELISGSKMMNALVLDFVIFFPILIL